MKTKNFIKKAYKTAKEHGFHEVLKDKTWMQLTEAERNDEALRCIMLIICEVAELVEADRKKCRAMRRAFNDVISVSTTYDYETLYKNFIKGSIEEELADILIRLFDFCGMVGLEEIPLDRDYIKSDFKEDVNKTAINCLEFIETCVYPLEDIIHCDFSVPIIVKTQAWRMSKFVDAVLKIGEILGFSEKEIEEHIKLKMKLNEMRAFKHGKKY